MKHIDDIFETMVTTALEVGKMLVKTPPHRREIIGTKPPKRIITNGDEIADKVYIERTEKLAVDYKCLIFTEENTEIIKHEKLSKSERVIVMDSLDGSDSWLNNEKGYVTQWFYAESGKILFSGIYHPVSDELYIARNEQSLLIKNGKEKRLYASHRSENLVMIISRSRKRKGIDKYFDCSKVVTIGSAGYKAAQIASGNADFCVYDGRKLKIWDFGPAIPLLNWSGGRITNFGNRNLQYNGMKIIPGNGVIMDNEHCHKYVMSKVKKHNLASKKK